MSRKKFPPLIEITQAINDYASNAIAAMALQLSEHRQKLVSNELVLRRLMEAGLIDPCEYNSVNVRLWHNVDFTKTLTEKQRTKLLGRLYSCVGSVVEDGSELVNGAKRIIKVKLKMKEHPHSSVHITYLRKYTKEEEKSKPCKIKEVVVQRAQPAQPELKELRLVCQQQS